MKECGELGIEFIKDDNEGTRVSRDFLTNLVTSIVKRSTAYFDDTGDNIFIYREKQLHSVVCPSIADLTNGYVMEHPLTRKPAGEDEYSGFVDYWINYRNYSFAMEMKHRYFAYRKSDQPNQKISSVFNSAINQLNNIRKEQCRDLMWFNRGLIKIALQTIVFYQSSQDDIVQDELKNQDFKKIFKQLIRNTDLNEKSNFRSLWLPSEGLIKSVEYNNGFEIYPAVAFVGKVFDVI